MVKPQELDALSPEERMVVGEADDYDWEHPVAAPPAATPQGRSQFSMRIDPELHRALVLAAQARGVRFSDVVRDALQRYVGGGDAAVGTTILSVGAVRVRTAGDVVLAGPTRGTPAETSDNAPRQAITQVAGGA